MQRPAKGRSTFQELVPRVSLAETEPSLGCEPRSFVRHTFVQHVFAFDSMRCKNGQGPTALIPTPEGIAGRAPGRCSVSSRWRRAGAARTQPRTPGEGGPDWEAGTEGLRMLIQTRPLRQRPTGADKIRAFQTHSRGGSGSSLLPTESLLAGGKGCWLAVKVRDSVLGGGKILAVP